MPLIEIKVFEDELSEGQVKELITKITDATLSVASPKLREFTWVTVSEVKSGYWGVAGQALGLTDLIKVVDS